MSALLLRPKKDQKYRDYWNIYDKLAGYSIVIATIKEEEREDRRNNDLNGYEGRDRYGV